MQYLARISGDEAEKPVEKVEPRDALAFRMQPAELEERMKELNATQGHLAAAQYLKGESSENTGVELSNERVFGLINAATEQGLNGEQMLSLWMAQDYNKNQASYEAVAKVGAAMPVTADDEKAMHDTIDAVAQARPNDVDAGLEDVAQVAAHHGINSPEAAVRFTHGVKDGQGRFGDEDAQYDSDGHIAVYRDEKHEVDEPDV